MRYQRYGIREELKNGFFWIVQLLKDLAIAILGISLVVGGHFLGEYEDANDREALKNFLKGFDDAQYYQYTEVNLIIDGIDVKIIQEPDSYRTYLVEARVGNYHFKGKVFYGQFIENIEYSKCEDFWDTDVMMHFGGIICIFIGVVWFVFKRSLGLHSIRELYDVGLIRSY